jgi:hypothetical protein
VRLQTFALAVAAALSLAAGVGCRVQSVINSEPQGARVVVDGYEGVTPFTASLAITTFGSYPMQVELEGYEPYEGEITTEPNVGIILLSFCFPPALLFDWNRPVALTMVELRPVKPFPETYSTEVPWTPVLPPLPHSMEDSPSRPASRPASR